MRFWLGFLIGMLCGGGGMYLALERSWMTSSSPERADAGTALTEDGKDGRKDEQGRRKRDARKRGARGSEAGPGNPGGGDVPVLSEADRALVWRGQAVALPPRELDLAGGGEGRALDAGEVNAVIRGQSEPVLACIAEARGQAALTAKILIKMLVDGSGRVTKVRTRAPAYLFAHGFQACAERAARAMRFPATGAHTLVDAPYDLY